MTTEYAPRLFERDEDISAIGTGLLACSLPREAWTHEAHLAACLWLVRERADIDVEERLPDIIRRFNESVGGVNDDGQGYHETLTQLYIGGVRAHVAACAPDLPLAGAANALIAGSRGRRDWPFIFYSRDRLFSVEARRRFIAPDLRGFDAVTKDLRAAPRAVPFDE